MDLNEAIERVKKNDVVSQFRYRWQAGLGSTTFFFLAQCLDPTVDKKKFDEAWDTRLVLHEDFDTALLEFAWVLHAAGEHRKKTPYGFVVIENLDTPGGFYAYLGPEEEGKQCGWGWTHLQALRHLIAILEEEESHQAESVV